MKSVFLKIIKVFLIITAILLTIVLTFGIALSLDWPWWVGIFLLLGLVGLWLAAIFIKKIWDRKREKHFVHQVIEQDEANIKNLHAEDAELSQELQARWKEAIEALKTSHLKKFGNPLYVLPWYMVIGESGSGKTTAIKSARLSSPFTEISQTSGISGTRNCDWWFFEHAILIDTAGRYTIPVDEDRDKKEWQKFLLLLAKFRKKEPLNGLVVTISADMLLESGAEVLEGTGQSIRRRIDELMRVIGTKFPVYVLVTKCDLVQGMAQFCEHLPEKNLNQAMGLVNRDFSTDVAGFLDRTIHFVAERLRDLRLLLLHKPATTGFPHESGQSQEPGFILFPEEFEGLKSGLNSFTKGVFQENPYQETPLLRGLFFSSGRQEGTPYSHFLKTSGLIGASEVLPGTSKGLFLHDFFSKILPKDRHLFAPTIRTLQWSRFTKNIGLIAWVTIAIAICGLLSFSFVKNLKILRDIPHEFSKPPALQGDILADLSIMDHYRRAILKVEKKNSRWWIPRFGLNESSRVEIQLKNNYSKQFREVFSASLDRQMVDNISAFSAGTPGETLGLYVAYIVRRINLLNARLNGGNLEFLQTKLPPSHHPVLLEIDSKLIPEIVEKFADLNLYYLIWQQDSNNHSQDMKNLQAWLDYILTLKGTNLNWLADWINANPSFAYLSLKDFWGDRLAGIDEITVPPPFTLRGREQIYSLIQEMESALLDPLLIVNKKLEFQEWYNKAYARVWYDFGSNFSKGEYWLTDRDAWQQVASVIASDQGPYFLLFDRMAAELKGLDNEGNLGSWIKLVHGLSTIRAKGTGEQILKKLKTFEKVAEKGKKLIAKFDQRVEGVGGEKTLGSQLTAAKAFNDYQQALLKIAQASESKRVAYQLAAIYFSEDPATSESPFFKAQKSLKILKTSLAGDMSDQKMFWELVAGPLNFLRDFVNLETACYINSLWEKNVLVEIEGISDKIRINKILFGSPDGYAMKFINVPAAPFLSRSLQKGFYPTTSLAKRLPFTEEFLVFLTKSIRIAKFGPKISSFEEEKITGSETELEKLFRLSLQSDSSSEPQPEIKPEPIETPPEPLKDSYAVSIKSIPTDVNADARIKPHATQLELKCVDKTYRLINLQYPRKETFNWSPKNCQEVILNIEIGSLILAKKYTGNMAFPMFLKDFKNGNRTFHFQEFPKYTNTLKHMGVKYIKVNYEFKNHLPVIKVLTWKADRAKRIEAAKKAEERRKADEARKKADQLKKERKEKSVKEMIEEWEARTAIKAMEEQKARAELKARRKKIKEVEKKMWETKIPQVPMDIVTCWDR